jgi:hypothetical protein
MKFKRISVPGQSTVELSKIIASNMDWRQALG